MVFRRGAMWFIYVIPIFDAYSNKLWPSIKVKKISRNIYIYELKKKGNLIKLGNKKYNINRIESLKAKMNYLKIFKNKKIIVTGHTGFKGSWLTLWLHSLGAKLWEYLKIYQLNHLITSL